METSRIFVRGLPPNLTAEEFKKHFSQPSSITDAKFIPHRRIGYVGYKSHDDAAKAIKYFNKSYIRMSRIAVELARPIADQPESSVKDLSSVSNEVASRKKQKLTEDTLRPVNPKLQEFLEVMQPPSKSKTWANEENARTEATSIVIAQEVPTEKESGQSDQEYEHVPKKRKRSQDSEPRPKGIPEHSVETAIAPVVEHGPPGIISADVEGDEAMSHVPESQAAPTSDADWLRTRTSRLLGLVDDDHDTTPSTNAQMDIDDKVEVEDEHVIMQPSKMSDAGSQTEKEPLNDTSVANDTAKIAEDESLSSGRLFIRNLSYATSEDDLRAYFGSYGHVSEVHISMDARTRTSKGFAYVQYEGQNDARTALASLDGKPFQGRLLHILPASAKKQHVLDEFELSKLPIKRQKEIRRKAEAASSTFKWNSMYMNADAVMSSISNRLGIAKSEILDPTSSDSAVKQAHAETNIIQETKAYFASCGVNLDAFKKREFSDTAILVKNFTYGTSPEELKQIFEAYGTVTKVLLPPSGTIAIVELEHATQARSAFGALSYRKFKDSILFLEKAPKEVFDTDRAPSTLQVIKSSPSTKISAADLLEDAETPSGNTATLFVRNLNFSTTTEQLTETFRPLDGFMSARVKTRTESKRPGQILSMGFGFLEFRSKSQAQAALAAMNGYRLHGHDLVLKTSHKAADAAEERRNEDQAKKIAGRRTKIIVKNLPFEASKKDVRSLFGAYGQVRSVRVPKKFDSSTRGFAFVDFVTVREAENAMDALRDTHLLGRRLVLDFAAGDDIDPEEEIEKMQKKVGRQADKVAIQKLTSVGRKKFNVGAADEGDDD